MHKIGWEIYLPALGTLFYGRLLSAAREIIFIWRRARAGFISRGYMLCCFSRFSSLTLCARVGAGGGKNPTGKAALGLLVSRNWLHSGLVSVSIAARSELKSVYTLGNLIILIGPHLLEERLLNIIYSTKESLV